MDLEDRVFSTPEGARISDKYVAVRLLGGTDLDAEGKDFMRRFDVGGYPTLLAMTAEGAVVSREFDRTADGILSGMDAAVAANTQFLAREAELKAKSDPAGVRELAGLYRDRAQLEPARAGYEKLVSAAKPDVEDQLALLDVVEKLGDGPARRSLLTRLVDTRKDDVRHIEWRMDLAMVDLPTQITSREEWMEVMAKRKDVLGGLLAQVEKPADQAAVRHALASALANTGDVQKALEHWNWILENARDSQVVPDALWVVAQNTFKGAKDPFTGDMDLAKLEACRAMLQEIVDAHADHPLAGRVKQMALPAVVKAIEAQKAKQAAAAKPDDAPEEDDEPDDGE